MFTIHCTDTNIAKSVQAVIEDFARPLDISVTTKAISSDVDAVVLLGATTEEISKYVQIAPTEKYRYIKNLACGVNAMTIPPNIGIESPSLTEVIYRTYITSYDVPPTLKSMVRDITYLGIADATDRYQDNITPQITQLKAELEMAGADIKTCVKYLKYTISMKEMRELLPLLTQYTVCGPQNNIALVLLPNGNTDTIKYATSMLTQLDSITIAVGIVKHTDTLYSATIKSVDSHYSADEVAAILTGNRQPATKRLQSTCALSIHGYDTSDVLSYISSIINKEMCDTYLSKGEMPPGTIPVFLQRVQGVSRIIDISQLTDYDGANYTITQPDGTILECNEQYLEILPNGSLLPLTEEQFINDFMPMSVASICASDRVTYTDSYKTTLSFNNGMVFIDRNTVQLFRLYLVTQDTLLRGYIAPCPIRMYSPITSTLRHINQNDVVITDNKLYCIVVSQSVCSALFEYK